MHIITVCGNGIGSSLMLAGKVQEICDEEGIAADVESMDLNGASSMKEMGMVMSLATKELAGKAEGRAISAMVKRLLS